MRSQEVFLGVPIRTETRKTSGGLGSVVSSPTGVRGRAPAKNGFWCIWSLKEHIWWQQIWYFSETYLVAFTVTKHKDFMYTFVPVIVDIFSLLIWWAWAPYPSLATPMALDTAVPRYRYWNVSDHSLLLSIIFVPARVNNWRTVRPWKFGSFLLSYS